jgi:hypothetical protein
MAPRREWTEWHLTPRGWEIGSTRHGDSGNNWQSEPEDRVLSATYKEQQTSTQPEPTTGVEESWRTKDPEKAASIPGLLQKYGSCPTRLKHPVI